MKEPMTMKMEGRTIPWHIFTGKPHVFVAGH